MKSSDLRNQIAIRIREFYRVLKSEFNQILESKNLTNGEFLVIKSLAFDNKKVSELAAEIGVSLPYITSLSSKMVEKNILKRENLEADKRIVVLKLTQKGEKIYSELDKRINDFLKEKFEHLNNSEIKTFDSILKKLI